MPNVMIFAPSPLLTVTLEGDASGTDLHLHAGGQGVWQARMLRTLDCTVTLCAALTGESGRVVQHLLEDEGITVQAVRREGRGAAYVHDRRSGERTAVAELSGDPLSRHDLDELYAITLREAMDADLVLLSGPSGEEEVLPDDVYRRLASDLHAAGRIVVVDLAGSRLAAALAGGVRLAKVSDSELLESGAVTDTSTDALIAAALHLRSKGAHSVVITRAGHATLVVDGDTAVAVRVPVMEEVDSSGAGDSFTAALAASLAQGQSLRDAVALGAAAGALNVTRHGLGTGDGQGIRRLSREVEVRELAIDDGGRLSPDELAARVEVDRT
ncbi:bifunctional hydroxymethylpyrimidine kinase/phosphomethylpyrimidine kinase [Agromyces sp. ISL-38]|uniref:PfkB family carbohydrate kinase n=1 Tax=Agromyces sp. ISL-38 TaxID=2819107 RepID=UPI001BEA48A0|nr:PfkB family carbohydrate kinase [Agromyces sp. ISL-38]MBT2498062.1 bifunctional hydroxymethylpyrimidine kinase/phosphomethylpyrimidine kinase [Agromyces sp. ISL-38]